MPRRRQRESVGRSVSRNIDEFIALGMALRQQLDEEKRLGLEEERAGRAEERADVRLGIATRGEERTIAGIEKEETEKADIARPTSDALAAPAVQTAVSGFREAKGVDAANLRVQQLGGAQTQQEATAMAIQLQTDTEEALKLAGEEKGREEFVGSLDPKFQTFAAAKEQGFDVQTSREVAGLGQEAAGLSDDEKFLMTKLLGVLTKADPLTGTLMFDKETAVEMLNTVAGEAREGFPREEVVEEEVPVVPTQEETVPGDFAPAGALPPEEARLGTAVLPGQQVAQPPSEEAPKDVEAAIQEWIKAGRAVADIDVAKLARFYDMDEVEVQTIISRFANTAP